MSEGRVQTVAIYYIVQCKNKNSKSNKDYHIWKNEAY